MDTKEDNICPSETAEKNLCFTCSVELFFTDDSLFICRNCFNGKYVTNIWQI